jgi:hypothetical protein
MRESVYGDASCVEVSERELNEDTIEAIRGGGGRAVRVTRVSVGGVSVMGVSWQWRWRTMT